ncbi:MAG: polyphosphate kinase 1 [Opitutales bacterium]
MTTPRKTSPSGKPKAARTTEPSRPSKPARSAGKAVPASGQPLPDERSERTPFFNRELSWLAFNRRVLEQAMTDSYPLLERMRFLAFVSSNLDEFFEIRVAGLMQQVKSGVVQPGLDGLGPKEQLRRINGIVDKLVRDQYSCWRDQIVPALATEDIHFKTKEILTKAEVQWLDNYFEEEVYPVLTPLAIDPAHPFPQITNKSLNILVGLADPNEPKDPLKLAIIPVPRILPRVVHVDLKRKGRKAGETYIFLSDVIRLFADRLFPGYTVKSAHAFRITRNSDLYIDDEEVENLLLKIEEELYKLQKGAAVRLEIRAGVPEELLEQLLDAIDLEPQNVYHIQGPINLTRLMSVADLIDRPDLKFKSFYPYTPPALAHGGESIFETIKRDDVFLHHPFESFTPVVDFLEEAARDPHVFAIKQTLYRTSGDSPIVNALIRASRQGKQVTVLVEIKARFDEANNIQWARQLEDVGVHVVYGLVGLKTHCKCSLVVRREPKGLRRYAHLGTGNYNPKTARLYTDFSYFTARQGLTSEVADLFNTLTGYARKPDFRRLFVAPFNLHRRIQRLILKEAENARQGKPARIIAKVNSLIDQETIEHLYEASRAGVKIDLIVRGICGLVPGVPDLSETIEVRSILGRYLEHSRVFYFANADSDPRLLVGSADWMPRNFFRRIECVFPIEDADVRDRIMGILETYLKDNNAVKFLRPNGSYVKAVRGKNEPVLTAQQVFTDQAKKAQARADAERASQQEALDKEAANDDLDPPGDPTPAKP